ncbi:MAG: hypothetical protein COC04_05375 [Gammaproteobacteria bacterium]|nr:MAG: hypothetical protein COC04_05375 [Gammaproteobacteria bacterium]
MNLHLVFLSRRPHQYFAMRFLSTIFSTILLIVLSLPLKAEALDLQAEYESLTSECEKKNIVSWVNQFENFGHQLYIQSKNTHLAKLESESELYWLYAFFGTPYLHQFSNNQAYTGCWVYLNEFENALNDKNTKVVEHSLDVWQACVWDLFRKPQVMVDKFIACYNDIPKM